MSNWRRKEEKHVRREKEIAVVKVKEMKKKKKSTDLGCNNIFLGCGRKRKKIEEKDRQNWKK